MKQIYFSVEGQDVRVWAFRSGRELWYHYAGETFLYTPSLLSSQSGQRGAKRGAIPHDKVLSPMPGKVTKILVKVGDQVEVSQAVIVVEAMKMEYTLESSLSGRIEKIHFHPGDQVTLGAELISIESSGQINKIS